MAMLKKIADLVQAQGHCVLATCARDAAGCAPHTSLMSFCPSADSLEFWLATLSGTRKYANLCANPRASLLLDDRQGGEPGQALTVEAVLQPFAGQAETQAARRALVARHPSLAGFLALEGALVLRLVGLRYQLLNGFTDVLVWTPEIILDDPRPKA